MILVHLSGEIHLSIIDMAEMLITGWECMGTEAQAEKRARACACVRAHSGGNAPKGLLCCLQDAFTHDVTVSSFF